MTWHLFDTLTCTIGGILTLLLYFYSYKKKSYQLAAYIPSVWTSLGILFTFISIYKGLDGDGYKDTDALIKNIIPAFSTSIIGIIGSIVTSIVNKTVLASVEQKAEIEEKKFYSSIVLQDSNYSPEIILIEILKEIKGNNSINESCNKAIDNLYNLLEGKMDDLLVGIKMEYGMTRDTVSGALKEQRKTFEENIEILNESFEGKLKSQRELFEQTLNSLNIEFINKLESIRETLEDRVQRMQQSNHDTIIAFVRDVKHDFVSVVKDNIVKESEDRRNKLQQFITEENDKITEFIRKQIELYENINNNMYAITADIRRLFETDVKQTIIQFAELQHKESTNTISLCNAKLISDANDYLNNHVSALSVYLYSLDRQTKETYDSFQMTVKAIAQTVEQKLESLYNQQIGFVAETIKDNRESLSASIEENKENIQTILDANKNAMENVSNAIKNDNEEIKSELVEQQKRWKESAEKIQTKAELEIAEIQKRVIAIESGLQEKLNAIKDAIVQSIKEFNQKLNDVRDDSVKQNVDTIDSLRKMINDRFPIDELQTAGGRLLNGIDETLIKFDNNTSKISTNLNKVASSIEESSVRYAETIKGYDDKLGYIESTLNTLKQHITSISILEQVLNDIKEAVHNVEVLRNGVIEDSQDITKAMKSKRDK